MIILSDCLGKKLDEGAIKVANSLVRRIKAECPGTMVLSYGSERGGADLHLHLNRLFLNPSFLRMIRRRKEPLLYIPFASNTRATALRLLILSRFTKFQPAVLFSLRHPMDRMTRLLLKMSRAKIVVLSRESRDFFEQETGNNCLYLKAGIDLKKFVPADPERRRLLREKYGVLPGKKVLVHVGHLKAGRNVDKLLNVGDDYQIFLAVSSVTKQDPELRRRLEAKKNLRIVDEYLEHIEELYQIADVYLFPVWEEENCIDVPLSVLEAAACQVPIVTSPYGELKTLIAEPGFCFLNSFEKRELQEALDTMSGQQGIDNRSAVKDYDWDQAAVCLERWIRKKQIRRAALVGLDGSGKSANLNRMKRDAAYRGYRFLWVRWKPLLLKPAYLILESRLHKKGRGTSESKTLEYGQKSGLKERIFRHSVVRKLWMMMALADYLIQFYGKTAGMLLRGEKIVFDRFYLDLFVDQGINFGYTPKQIAEEIRRFGWLFPKLELFIYLRVSPEVCFARKDDIPSMDYLNRRYEIYEYLSQSPEWKTVDGEASFEEVNREIKDLMGADV